MAIFKLILLTAIIIGIVFLGLSLKVLLGKTKKTECESNSSDVGYSCGCGGGNNCSTNKSKKGF